MGTMEDDSETFSNSNGIIFNRLPQEKDLTIILQVHIICIQCSQYCNCFDQNALTCLDQNAYWLYDKPSKSPSGNPCVDKNAVVLHMCTSSISMFGNI